MPRPRKLKTKSSNLQNINELDSISIYQALLQGKFKNSDLIEKLEDQNSMYNFLIFYLEIAGLERIVEKINGHNIEDIKLDEELSKLEKLQEQNDDCLINEEACKNIIEKNTQFLENIHSFYSILFSTQTNLPFEIKDFFKYTFNWLNSITQSRFRLIRISGLEIIAIIMEKLIKFLSENDNIQKEKECLKFLQNLIDYLVNFRARDILPQIRRRVCQIVFLPFGIQQFNFDVYYGQIGDLFISVHHECREQALIELEKYSFELIHSFMSSEQESVISLLFDQNESIQIKLIHFISHFISQYKKYDQSFFNKQSKQAFIRQLFCQNTRVKYEVARIIQYLEPKISSTGISPTLQLENLIKFFVENVPDEQIGFNECFSFVFSFLPHHQYLMNPYNYMQILLSEDEKELSRICMLFYAGILEFSQNINDNLKNLWWIDINDEQQEIVTNLRQNFTNCFLERMASINFANNESPQIVFAYLQVYLKLDFKLFDTIMFKPKLKSLFEQILRTLQKQSNEEIIYCIGELILKCRNEFSNNDLLQEFQIEISKYIQDLLEIDPINQITICKVESFIKYNLIRWDKLLTPKLLKSLQEISPRNQSNILLAVIKLYGSSLQSTLRALISNYKSINDDLDGLYKEIRAIFYLNAFKILEEVQISDLQFHVLQLVIQNLTYTNNQKMFKLGFSQKLNSEQLSLLCSLVNQLIMNDLLKQKQSSQKSDSLKGSAMKLDDLPQLNIFQMQLLHNVVTLLSQSQVILITPQFGIPLLCQFIQISMKNQFFKEYTLILVKLGESISKLMEQDLIYKRQDFWQFINDFISQLKINPIWDNDEHCNEFAKLIISALLAHTNKGNVKDIRERFIGFCAELIEKAFSSIDNSPYLTLLTQIFYKPTKLIKALQIDKLTYKKFSAFYEITSKQFHSEEHTKEHKALIEKKEGPLKVRLRQQTGLSNQDMEKILKDKKQNLMESDRKMDENALDIEEPISLKKQQKK